MSFSHLIHRHSSSLVDSFFPVALAAVVFTVVGCASSPVRSSSSTSVNAAANLSAIPPTPDPRIGLRPGAFDAAEAVWNLRVLSETRPSEKFIGGINSDLAFLGNNVFQGSFSGYQVCDISNPQHPTLKEAYVCPASQSDVSVYRNLLFVSGEDLSARIDCGAASRTETGRNVSHTRSAESSSYYQEFGDASWSDYAPAASDLDLSGCGSGNGMILAWFICRIASASSGVSCFPAKRSKK